MSDSQSSVEAFISRWKDSGAAERANYALFLSELCDVLDTERPRPTVPEQNINSYVIDRAITRSDKDGKKTTVYADLYKRGSFMLETKQGAAAESSGIGQEASLDVPTQAVKTGHGVRGTKAWDKTLEKAYGQARGYIRDLPADEGRPPFLIVCDVGHVIELYAEFTGTGGTYLRFPNPKNHRIYLDDLRDPDTRELLRKVWDDPHALDPSKHAAKVTREVSDTLAKLAQSLEKDKHDVQVVAIFLQRLLFTMFAEDVGLLPEKSFEQLLIEAETNHPSFTPMIEGLWKDMAGANRPPGVDDRDPIFCQILRTKIPYFNGGLFENPTALPLNGQQIAFLIHAAKQDWKEVEPAIFGTLLERALDPRERHKLGAHYTPRSYVERLIEPTLMNPLREQWSAVKTAAALYHDDGKDDKALKEIGDFHRRLTELKILDPACGSGNFLYVALARLKELEAEVLDLFEELGGNKMFEMDEHKVRPSQMHGIEINARATAIAQLVLWIGYFQWHHKTTGKADTNDRPLLPKQQTILCRDAVLDYDGRIPRTDPETGETLTIWDGVTTKAHPVTGKEVPDESATKVLFDFVNPRRTEWPQADYIVGNPPFLGASRMRDGLGDGYVEALRKAWKKHKPDSWDFVMFWWHQAAEQVRDKKTQRFGFITTNSIHQTFNRRCLEPFLSDDKKPLSIVFAIPDHPWVDSADCAAVRIAMTVVQVGNADGKIQNVESEAEGLEGEFTVILKHRIGHIAANLRTGPDLLGAGFLRSNQGVSNTGVKLHGAGFIVDHEGAEDLAASSLNPHEAPIFDYRNGKDRTSTPRNLRVIDADGFTDESLCVNHPGIYNHLLINVKPERDTNNEKYRRENWWLFGRRNSELRAALAGLKRYISTVETSKHRFFVFLSEEIRPDNKLINFGLSCPDVLSVLSSSIHIAWTLANGSQNGPTPVYVKTRCFETFPFPDLPDGALKDRLRTLGEKLDAHRKARQAEHPELTLTGMYNVLEKLRLGTALSDKEKTIHAHGLVTLLKQIHDEIDVAVMRAYGWTMERLLPAGEGDYADTSSDKPPEHQSVESQPPDGRPPGRMALHKLPIADRLARGDEALEQAILQNLVDLNHERAAEEAAGKIRYLRPEFQDPDGAQSTGEDSPSLDLPEAKAAVAAAKTGKIKWPKDLPEKVAAIMSLLSETGPDAAALDQVFGRASKKRKAEIEQVLAMLESLGQI